MISRAAARRRVCLKGIFAGLRSVCFNSPSSDVLLSVKTRTIEEAQMDPQDFKA
jgi:hypothetical protein